MKTHDDRIIVDPGILVGKPVIKGTRIAVEHILRMLAKGEAEKDILHEYPQLTHEDIAAALRYGAELVGEEKIFPIGNFRYA